LMLAGISAVPPIPPHLRAALRQRLAAEGAPALHKELGACDPPSAARLRPGDGVRIIRALEVFEATGRSLSDWHRDAVPAVWDQRRAIKVFLAPERAELRRRIDQRFDTMVEAGALEEVRALAARNLDRAAPVMKAHGVPWLCQVLGGNMPLGEAACLAKLDTWRYTKRQFTWFRNQLPDFTWVEPDLAEATIGAALRERA